MPTRNVPRIALLMPVGPGPAEVDRLRDALASFDHYVAEPAVAVLLDGDPAPRDLPSAVGPLSRTTLEPVHTPPPAKRTTPRRGKGICPAVLAGLKHIAQSHLEVDFVLKLDTDALVIGPFAGRVRKYFLEHPGIGLIGAHDRTPAGEKRPLAEGAAAVRQLLATPLDVLHPIVWLRQRLNPDLRLIRGHIAAARGNGYTFGEHCQGGGYALSHEALLRLRDMHFLARPEAWHAADCPEDVMTGMYVRATGLRLAGQAAPGEVFGVRKRGLPYPPAELADKKYAVIHSVKNDERTPEADVRVFFRQKRQDELAEARKHAEEVDVD